VIAVKDRIALVRKSIKINQADFAHKIGLTKNYISLVETGGRIPSDRTITDICREFRVNEEWLRTGNGEMFRAKTRKDEMTEYVGKLVGGELDPFQTSLIASLAKLTPEQIDLLAGIAETMLEEYQKEKASQ
jgi:transcriptional regulator with XRE-family HTH domain